MTAEVHRILERLNLPTAGLESAPGFANSVWMTTDLVVRINDGRFRDAFKHEADVLAHLKTILPIPNVIAVEAQDSGGEVIVLERLPGTNLEDAWPAISSGARVSIVHQLGQLVRTLHSIPLKEWMRNPVFDEAITTGDARNAYHAPPHEIDMLTATALNARPGITELLTRTHVFVQSHLELFANDEDEFRFVHVDLHFRNVMVEGETITGIIDFEGARPAPVDVELDMLARWLRQRISSEPANYHRVIPDLRDAYPALFDVPNLVNRLEVYEILWQLVQIHHWHPGAKWMNDPAANLLHVLDGSFRTSIAAILAE